MNAATIPLSRSRKMLLASIAIAAIAGPIGIGVLHPRVVKADEAQNFANLKFDSASLTPSQARGKSQFLMQRGNEFLDNNVTLRDLIAVAFGVNPDRIVGGPDWIDTQHFDFEAHWTPTPATTSNTPPPPAPEVAITSATAGGPGHAPARAHFPTPATLQAMLRNFLAERVNLRVRDDSQVLPVYQLVLTNGGPKLTPTQTQPSSEETRVRMRVGVEDHVRDGQETYAITNAPPRVLCDHLSGVLGREVVDRTGLTGRYDFEISFPYATDPDKLAAILRDQYGLDLQSAQQPVKVVAVDNVEVPQGN